MKHDLENMTKLEQFGRFVLRTVKKQLSITAIAVIVALSLSLFQILDIRGRKQQLVFHNEVGLAVLEHGHYKRARRAFEDALKLDSGNAFSAQGLLVSEMFLEFDEPDWEPSMGWLMQKKLETLGLDEKFDHLLLKYGGDVALFLGDFERARSMFNEALRVSPDYVDALYSDGWAAYQQPPKPSIDGMLERFETMTRTAPRDYRGFHGYGYALYMQAVQSKPHSEQRQELLTRAARQSQRAANFQFNYVNIVADLGEIARTAAPTISLYYHQQAKRIMENPRLSDLKENSPTYIIRLLHEGRQEDVVFLNTRAELEAWLYYQLSLDYLSLFIRSEETEKRHEEEHLNYLKKAKSVDHERKVFKTYEDQKAILEDSVQRTEG